MDEFYYVVEVDGLSVMSSEKYYSTREAYIRKLKADEEGDSCKIYCEDVDLTNNILLMGGKRNWGLYL